MSFDTLPPFEGITVKDKELALANIRFIAGQGGEPEFYDILLQRLVDLTDSWMPDEMDPGDYETLLASKRRLAAELSLLRTMAALRQK